MTTVLKITVSTKGYQIDDICNEAKPLDIILFNNKEFALTSIAIKLGTISGFNHAALVMDAPPEFKYDASSKNEQTTNDGAKYLYEYAGNGQPLTYQKLEDKLKKERFNSITLIRLGEIDRFFSEKEDLNKAINQIKENFKERMGFSSADWNKLADIGTSWREFLTNGLLQPLKELQKIKSALKRKKYLGIPIDNETELSEKQKKGLIGPTEDWNKIDPREKKKRIKNLKYHFLGILQLTFMALGIVTSIHFIIITIFGGVTVNYYSFSFAAFLITTLAWCACNFKYPLKTKDTSDRRQICSSYPPEVIKMIMVNKGVDAETIKTFADKWLNGTPPSPKNLYTLGETSDGCIIYKYSHIDKAK
ncbi:TPA: hypothetical protein KEW64_002538 [Proteus mirabilis]|nr:hypothetical protein [Proteus mirabilis]